MNRSRLNSVLILIAAGLIVYGVWRIYAPAGWIVAGGLLLADQLRFKSGSS